ncbi:acyl-CoA thioester hydrolase YciA [Buchnera aphidicola]|uniref:acyl-CoA thioester hydrolase YciA n=1 Tax=Buchnera aphidicola TaxID=9 RepID=UPI00346443AF
MSKQYILPTGIISLKTLTMPSNTNSNGNIFGGWIMSQIDIGGAILAKEISGGKVVTVQVNSITFLKPIYVGDIMYCYTKCVKIGVSSMTIDIEIWIKNIDSQPLGQFYCAAYASVIYVAIDTLGRSRKLLPMSIV